MQFTRLTARPGPPDRPGSPRRRLVRPGLAFLLAALAIEFADELVDGTKSAAMPLIRHDLALSYLEVGLLSAVPLIAGGLLELPLGVLAGTGRGRRRAILAGGLVFIAAVLGAAFARSFWLLLAAFLIFFPASGAFVSLSQAALMDAEPARRAQHMARWTFAGAVGGVAGPLVVTVVLAAGGTWRLAFALIAVVSAGAWAAMFQAGRRADGAGITGPAHPAGADEPGTAGDPDSAEPGWPGGRAAVSLIRGSGVLRVLVLLQVSDLVLDVLTTFLALYLVASAQASPALAALGVAVRLGAGVAGYGLLTAVLDRFDSQRVLRVSVWLTAPLYPAFLLVPGLWAKLAVLAALTLATTPWYPVLQAGVYDCLPGQSGLAVSLESAAGLAGGIGPLVVGLLAQHLGLSWAMTVLCAAPLLMLLARPRRGARGPGKVADGQDEAAGRQR
jgi:MFS transporter, FSR family, fosmidomycin resistance protein